MLCSWAKKKKKKKREREKFSVPVCPESQDTVRRGRRGCSKCGDDATGVKKVFNVYIYTFAAQTESLGEEYTGSTWHWCLQGDFWVAGG